MIEAVVMGDLQRYRWGAQKKKNISELVLKDKSTDKRLFLVSTMLLNTHLLPFLNMPCSFFQCMYWALVTSSLNATSSVVAIVVGILESEAGTRWWEVVWSARMIYSAGHLNTLCPPNPDRLSSHHLIPQLPMEWPPHYALFVILNKGRWLTSAMQSREFEMETVNDEPS